MIRWIARKFVSIWPAFGLLFLGACAVASGPSSVGSPPKSPAPSGSDASAKTGGPHFANAPIGGMIAPNTPQAAEVLNKLRQAEYLDKMNAQSYTSIHSEEGQFYYRKARQITEIINRLQSGQSVSRDDVDWSLDNSEASIYGPPP